MPVANTDDAISRMSVRRLGCCGVAGTRTTDVGLRFRTNQVSPTTGTQRDRIGHRPEICGSGGNQPAVDGARGPGYISSFTPVGAEAERPQRPRRPKCNLTLAVCRSPTLMMRSAACRSATWDAAVWPARVLPTSARGLAGNGYRRRPCTKTARDHDRPRMHGADGGESGHMRIVV